MNWTVIVILGLSLTGTSLAWTYHLSRRTMNWTVARHWCLSNHGDMVVIQNQAENDHVVSMLPYRTKSPYYWIGITKKHKNEAWTWIGNNSTWIGEHSWAPNEPNNNHSTEFCVEIYANTEPTRGKWNDEKCGNKKYVVCSKPQCNATSCDRGRCQETIGNTTCLCEPGFEGDRCQTAQSNATSSDRGRCQETIGNTTCRCEPEFEGDGCQKAVECPPPSPPDNGHFSCPDGSQIFNTTCRFTCDPGFLLTGSSDVTCGLTGDWSGPRPSCSSYRQALLAVLGCAATSALCCACFCWMKRRKRKKLAQLRHLDDAGPSSEVHG